MSDSTTMSSNSTEADLTSEYSKEDLPPISDSSLRRSPTEYGYRWTDEDEALPVEVTEGDVIVREGKHGTSHRLVLETYEDTIIIYVLGREQYNRYAGENLAEDIYADIYSISILRDPWGLREEARSQNE